MGNRGRTLHNAQQEIVRSYGGKRWICCLLEFKGRRRQIMSPGQYTELFFLDEATAFAAGHRPCAECRRERYKAFRAAWMKWNVHDQAKRLSAEEIDAQVHPTRINTKRQKVTYEATLNSLPNGVFVAIDGSSYLVWDQSLLLWSPEGYTRELPRPNDTTVTVLTPKPFVECLRQGYQPGTHWSHLSLFGNR